MRPQRLDLAAWTLLPGSALIVLTAICSALLAAEPLFKKPLLRQGEGRKVKAAAAYVHLAAASHLGEMGHGRTLGSVSFEASLPPANPVTCFAHEPAGDLAWTGRVIPRARFQRPPPAHAEL